MMPCCLFLRQRRCDNESMTTGFTSPAPYPITRRGPERVMAEPTQDSAKKPAWDELLGHSSPGFNICIESKASVWCCVSIARLHGSRIQGVEEGVAILTLTFPSIIHISYPEKVSCAKLEFLFFIWGAELRKVENTSTK